MLSHRFSELAVAAVAAVALTGFINGWFLVGTVGNLVGTLYGQVLIGKVVLFLAAVVIGGVNHRRLLPQLGSTVGEGAVEQTAARLRRNVKIELALAGAVIGVVSVLGLLEPSCCRL